MIRPPTWKTWTATCVRTVPSLPFWSSACSLAPNSSSALVRCLRKSEPAAVGLRARVQSLFQTLVSGAWWTDGELRLRAAQLCAQTERSQDHGKPAPDQGDYDGWVALAQHNYILNQLDDYAQGRSL